MWEKLFFYWLHSTPMWSVVVLQCSHLWYSDSQSRCCICSQWTKGQYAFSVCLVVHPVCTVQILLNMNTGLSGISINILMQAPHCQWAEPPEFNWCIVISPSTSTELRIHWPPSSAWFTWWQQTQYLRQKPFPAFIHSIFRIEENSCDYPFICSSMLLFDLFHCWLAFLHSFTSSVLIVFVQYFSPSKFIHCAICSPCKAFCKKPAIQKTLWINLT